MFSITVIPSARLKLAVWLAATWRDWSATWWKPAPLSMVAEAPGTPCNSATLAPSPTRSMRYSVAILAPATLSEAIWQSTSTPLTPRSTAITLIPWDMALFTAGATASESTGLTISTPTFLDTKSSMSLVCLAASSPASTTTSSTLFSVAAFLAPSVRVTKNGLFRVETEKPITFPLLPSLTFSSPSMVMALQPPIVISIVPAAISASIFLIFTVFPSQNSYS